MKISLLLLLIFVWLSSGQINNKHKGKNNETLCSDSLKFVTLIALTLDLPNLQQYFEVQETLNQKELVILNNRNFLGVDKLKKFNLSIKLMNETEIRERGIKSFIEYEEIKIKNDTAYVYYRYAVQGIGIESTYFLKNCHWQLVNSELWEN